MNPQEQDHASSFELPPAHPNEQVPAPMPEHQDITSEAQSAVALEHGVSQASPPAQQTQAMAQVPMPQAPPVPQPATPGGAPAQNGAVPQIADDTDLIEKEWVIKAKEIVAKTARDPHLQNKEITRFKAEYMRKRYNKDLKLSEDS